MIKTMRTLMNKMNKMKMRRKMMKKMKVEKMIMKILILHLVLGELVRGKNKKEDLKMMYRAEIINVQFVIRPIYHIQLSIHI